MTADSGSFDLTPRPRVRVIRHSLPIAHGFMTNRGYIAEWQRLIKAEQAERRANFCTFLDTYCAPRPKSYGDRKWLEGYAEFCIDPSWVGFHAIHIETREALGLFIFAATECFNKWTHRDRGQVDSYLDSVGC